MRWVGLTGKMGAGKDYLFKALREEFERVRVHGGPARVSFADQVRQELDYVLRPENEALFWQKPYSPDIRKLLQWWGTGLRRAEDPDYWVKKGEVNGIAVEESGSVPVFTDVRFPNEANMIVNHGGLLVEVRASAETRRRRLGTLPDHESETAMDDYDYPDDKILVSGERDDDYYRGWVRKILELTT